MICKHCEIESSKDEGVEVVRNEPITNENGLSRSINRKTIISIKVYYYFLKKILNKPFLL